MNAINLLKVGVSVLVLSLAGTSGAFAEPSPVPINANFQPDPLTLNGVSGGNNKTNCGNIATTPNQVIQVNESLPYLRFTVESEGKPTLLIDGPGGRFCVLADKYSGSKPEISGFWSAGKYLVYVGQSESGNYPYQLHISKIKPPQKASIKGYQKSD